MSAKIDTYAAEKSEEYETSKWDDERYEMRELEIEHPCDRSETRHSQCVSADLPPEADYPAHKSYAYRTVEHSHCPWWHKAMTPHSERTDDVGQEIGNERHIAIVNIAQSPMAHELEFIEKPDSEQRNDKCI